MHDKLDLNLLRVFDALMTDRQVAAAAQRIGLSAPATSNALARLRRATGDALFTRTPAGMQPTAYAQAVAPGIAQALATLEQSFAGPAAFDPATSRRAFRLAMSDIGEIWFLPTLMAALREAAPQVTLATVRPGTVELKAAMADGRVDLAIGWLPELGAGFHQRRLFTQRYVLLMAAGHPLARGRLTAERFRRARHAVVHAAGTGHERIAALLRRAGVAAPAVLALPHFVAVPYIVGESDLVVVVPEKLAERAAAPFGLAWREPPFDWPTFEVNVFWHQRAHQDAGNRWLRETLARRFAATPQ
jgi:DNA-binding transcriptional LysR family regulator